MENSNIELRSEKVRNIIGQIPPWIIRSGITLIFIILVLLVIISSYFKYPYVIDANVNFSLISDHVKGVIQIPSDEFQKVSLNQKMEVYFPSIPNMSLDEYIVLNIPDKTNMIEISNNGAYGIIYLSLNDTLITNKENLLIIKEDINGFGKIYTDEVSFLNRMISPIKNFLSNSKK